MRKKYCAPCDLVVTPARDGDCPNCGAGLDVIPRENQREHQDDDGQQYADPRDKKAGRE